MIAKLEIECKDPEIVLNSLKPDIDNLEKFQARIEAKKDKVFLTIEAKDISGLLAGINSYARLIRASMDVIGI